MEDSSKELYERLMNLSEEQRKLAMDIIERTFPTAEGVKHKTVSEQRDMDLQLKENKEKYFVEQFWALEKQLREQELSFRQLTIALSEQLNLTMRAVQMRLKRNGIDPQTFEKQRDKEI